MEAAASLHEDFIRICDLVQGGKMELNMTPKKGELYLHINDKTSFNERWQGDAGEVLSKARKALEETIKEEYSAKAIQRCPSCGAEMRQPWLVDDDKSPMLGVTLFGCDNCHSFHLADDSSNRDLTPTVMLPANTDPRGDLLQHLLHHEMTLVIWAYSPMNLRVYYPDGFGDGFGFGQRNYGGPIMLAAAHAVGAMHEDGLGIDTGRSSECPVCSKPSKPLKADQTLWECEAGHKMVMRRI